MEETTIKSRAKTTTKPSVIPPQGEEMKKRSLKRFFYRYFAYILIVLVILLALATGYFYRKSKIAPTTDVASQREAIKLSKEVGKLIVVPADEIPTIATVSDPAALKEQAFFAEASIGDKVLIYANAKKAILYSPTLRKIITVAPVNMGAKDGAPTTQPAPKP